MDISKLIEQYEKETEYNAMQEHSIGDVYTFRFVEWLASRPTCGVEQRKFLDEIEHGEYYDGDLCYKDGYLAGDSFPDYIDLAKVVKGE